jgi:NAD(P)-dependent dehydrogenase (short-subunit alcohol dehydrogenase family)
MLLTDKVALITGGAVEMGKAILGLLVTARFLIYF